VGNRYKFGIEGSLAFAIHMIRKGQACCSAAGVKVGLLHRFIVGMFGIEA
jgi:hypothetical protein